MATYKHLRSSTANKRPTTSIADGQLALNTNATSPGLFFKDSTGATIIKIGPVHVGTTAPNATPGAGGSSGNSTGEVWLDTSITPVGVKIWNGSAWVNGTPTGSTTVQGLLELATDVETQSGSDAARAVTPAGLQSKVSDSISTTSSTTIASSTAVKAAYDLAAAGLPRSGGTVTGNLEIGTTGSLTFEGSVADGFETTLAVTNPTADRVITLPNISGTVVTTGDTGSVTSAMIANGTIVSGDIASGTIVDSNISASAEIAVSKLADGAAGQIIQTDSAGTGVEWSDTANLPLGSAASPAYRFQGDINTGIYSPGADQVAISTNGTGRLFVDASGNIDFTAAGLKVTTGRNISATAANSRIGIFGGDIATNAGANIELYGGSHATLANLMILDAGEHRFRSADGSSEHMRLDSSGRLGLGTSTVEAGHILQANGDIATVTPFGAFSALQTAGGTGFRWTLANDGTYRLQRTTDGFSTATTPIYVDSSSRVGIGTTSPNGILTVARAAASAGWVIRAQSTGVSNESGFFVDSSNNFECVIRSGGNDLSYIKNTGTGSSTGNLVFYPNSTERARIDSSGRLLVGTSSAYTTSTGVTPQNQLAGLSNDACSSIIYNFQNDATTSGLTFAKSRGGSLGSQGLIADSNAIGNILFEASDGTQLRRAALISAAVDGTPGTNDMPGRLVFSTTADGASSPTERMRITNAGRVGIGTQGPASLCSVEGGNIALQSPGSSLGVRTTERLFLRSDLGSTNGMAAIGMNGTGTNGFLGEIKFYTGLSDVFNASLSERARIDSSGRLLVGTSSRLGSTEKKLEVANGSFGISSFANNAFASAIVLEKGRGTVPGTIVQNGDELGALLFRGDDGVDSFTTAASIYAYVDGTPGVDDMPGRLVFSTTADGSSSPTERMRITSSGELLVGTSSAVNNADLQAANSISVGGTIKREVSKRLNLADNTSTTLFTFQIPGGGSQSHRTYVGGEISYIVAVGRETSSRNSRTTYGKVYFSIDRFWESNANNPVSVNLIDTDKSLSTSNGSAPTITWAITTDAGIDNAAKNVYLAITVDNPFTNTIQTNITGTISYHTLSFSDVTLS